MSTAPWEVHAENLAHWERVQEFEWLLKDKEDRLLAERRAWDKRILREPFFYFWSSVSMAAFSVVGDFWTQTHEFLMGTSLVMGQSWLATTLIVVGLLGLLWAFVRSREILNN